VLVITQRILALKNKKDYIIKQKFMELNIFAEYLEEVAKK
jgi:hypothetical protein